MIAARVMLAAVLLLAALPASAQSDDADAFDPAALDPAALDPDFSIDDAPASPWQPFFEVRLRGDHVQGLPNNREDIDRARFRARAGTRYTPTERLTIGLAVEAALGSDGNADRFRNNDIERSDALNLDQAWLAFQPTDTLRLQVGKAPLPMQLSPMQWDSDLRPTGVSASLGRNVGVTDRWQLQAGWFAPDPLELGGARLAMIQAAYHWHEGAAWGAGALLSHLRFESIDTYARAGIARGNLVANGRYVNDYRPIDLQLYLRRRHEQWPLLFNLDVARNPGAETQRDGIRASAIVGDRSHARSWEFGWAWERIQRDAALAAVTEDDWWFHARVRGHMPWIGYGLDGTWSLRLAYFNEIRDAPRENTRRVLLDVEARW